MSTLFYGLNIASNALKTQSAVLNVTAHNISNAETPGYSRQTVAVESGAGATSSIGITATSAITIGNGTFANEVTRSRSKLYDDLYRTQNQELAYYDKTEDLINQVELYFDEPSERGFSQVVNDFFNGWQEVSNDPQNTAARQSLISYGEELVDRLHRLYDQLDTLRKEIDEEVATMPEYINEITTEIAELNGNIRSSENQGLEANDLRDKRDYLVDQLSEYANVKAFEQSDGSYTIIIGSQVVVDREDHAELQAVGSVDEDAGNIRTAILTEEELEILPEKGRLGALIEFRDETIDAIIDDLDTFTEALVTSVNYQHNYGYGLDGSTELNFFDPNYTKSFNIALSSDVEDVNKIAVSGDSTYGDNSNALKINAIKNLDVIQNQYTLSEYYNALVSDIGILGMSAQSGRTNEELLVSQIDNAREEIKGVSTDSELIQMITSQRIYQGASRIITVIDELLEQVVNLT